jgi:hypothetical protein
MDFYYVSKFSQFDFSGLFDFEAFAGLKAVVALVYDKFFQ